MTTDLDHRDRPGGEGAPTGPPPLSATTSIVTFGNLAWLAWLWGLLLAAFLAIVAVMAIRGGPVDESLWEGFGVGILRWLLLAAGIAIVPTFAPMLISNGVTRAQLSRSAALSVIALCALSAAVVAVGYALEAVAFAWADWDHVLRDGDAVDLATVGLVSLVLGVTHAAYMAAGWVLGIAFYRWGPTVGVPAIVPCAVPVVLVELVTPRVAAGTGLLGIDAVDLATPVGIALAAAVVAATVVAGGRATREVPLKD